MCIVLISTAHPEYSFILLSNRDEFIFRPTAPAEWWDAPNGHVLGARDLERKEHGTWLGITKQGRIAVLTNFREEGAEKVALDKSRGGIINAYLTSPTDKRESPYEFARRLIHQVGVSDVGGFSLMFGELRPSQGKDASLPGLSILSNRSASPEDLTQVATKPGETHGLSNSHFGDDSWPKVVQGEMLLKEAIARNVERESVDQDDFIESLFDILSRDSMPERGPDEEWDEYVRHMRESILIPPTLGPSAESEPEPASANLNGATTTNASVAINKASYGTQRQTVILVSKAGRAAFVERILYGDDRRPLSRDERQRKIEFNIEGWHSNDRPTSAS